MGVKLASGDIAQKFQPLKPWAKASRRTLGSLTALVLVSTSLVAGNSTPAHAAACGTGAASYGGGTGTSVDPYVITDASHLIRLSANSSDWGKSFLQADDVDLGDCDWTSIGSLTTYPSTGTAFTGVYDGGGYSIEGLKVGSQSGVAAGLFGWVSGSSAAVRNLKLFGQVASDDTYVGSLVGYASGSSSSDRVLISKVSSAVDVNYLGSGYAGGLVGDGTNVLISYSSFSGDMRADGSTFAMAAGFSGYTISGEVVDSYSISNFSGQSTYKAGVFGWGGGGNAQRVFSVPIGADAGFTNGGDTATSVFWDTTIGPAAAVRGGSARAGVTGLSTTELTTFSTYDDAGWGIVDGWEAFDSSSSKIWGICSPVNDGYPFLLWEYSSNPCPVESSPAQESEASEASGEPGIYLTVQARSGDRSSGSVVGFGGYSVAPNAPYLLTIQPVEEGLPQTVLARGVMNSGGHLEDEVVLGTLSPGSYKIVFVSRGRTGALLTLTNVLAVDRDGRFQSITPEALQPRVR